MSYANSFINAYGRTCTILRTPPLDTHISSKLPTRGTSDNWDLYREGLIPNKTGLSPGEVYIEAGENFLVRATYLDPQSGQIAFQSTKANAVMSHQRFEEDVDKGGNIVQKWKEITSDVYATAQATTAALLQKDPGLLSNTKWIFYVSAAAPIQKLDRLEFPNGTKCQVEDVDPLRLPGLLRIQCSDDLRGGELEE